MPSKKKVKQPVNSDTKSDRQNEGEEDFEEYLKALREIVEDSGDFLDIDDKDEDEEDFPEENEMIDISREEEDAGCLDDPGFLLERSILTKLDFEPINLRELLDRLEVWGEDYAREVYSRMQGLLKAKDIEKYDVDGEKYYRVLHTPPYKKQTTIPEWPHFRTESHDLTDQMVLDALKKKSLTGRELIQSLGIKKVLGFFELQSKISALKKVGKLRTVKLPDKRRTLFVLKQEPNLEEENENGEDLHNYEEGVREAVVNRKGTRPTTPERPVRGSDEKYRQFLHAEVIKPQIKRPNIVPRPGDFSESAILNALSERPQNISEIIKTFGITDMIKVRDLQFTIRRMEEAGEITRDFLPDGQTSFKKTQKNNI